MDCKTPLELHAAYNQVLYIPNGNWAHHQKSGVPGWNHMMNERIRLGCTIPPDPEVFIGAILAKVIEAVRQQFERLEKDQKETEESLQNLRENSALKRMVVEALEIEMDRYEALQRKLEEIKESNTRQKKLLDDLEGSNG